MRRLVTCAALAAFLAVWLPGGAAASTPERIRAAAERGEISDAAALLYRAYAIHAPEKVPVRLRAGRPYDGTLELVQLRADVARLPRTSPTRREVERVAAADAVGETCEGRTGATLDAADSPFYIQYDPIGGGLTLDDYRAALVTAHNQQVTAFGWIAPPTTRPITPPGLRYHVVIADLGAEQYGYTTTVGTFAGPVAARPVTSGGATWTVADGEASCMVLNSNIAQLTTPAATPAQALAALRATAAHEYNHALQFGLGVIESDDLNNSLLVEATSTLMEDEVQDSADDNLHYLTRTSPAGVPEPNFSDSLVPRAQGISEFYAAWFLLRGLTERFGTAVAGGAEQVPQLMWELTSGREPGVSYLGALDRALSIRSGGATDLGKAYHDAGIADWLMHDCGGNWMTPYCFEEAAAYRARFAPGGAPPWIPPTYTLAVGSATPGDAAVERNYAIEFVRLPSTGTYTVTVVNTETPGASFSALRASAVCDRGAGGPYRAAGSPATVAPIANQDTATITVDTTNCLSDTVALVISSANRATQSPQCDSQVRYSVAVSSVGGPTTQPNAPTSLPAQFCNSVLGPDPSPMPTPGATPTPSPPAAASPDPTVLAPAPGDLTPPKVTVSLARRTFRGLLTFTVGCPAEEQTRCDVSIRGSAARSRRKVVIKRAVLRDLAPGQRVKLRVRLKAAAIRKLGRGLVTVTLVTNANDGAGNRITGSRFVLKTRI